MGRALGVILVLIFVHSLSSRVAAQSFDYADRPEYKGETHSDASLGEVQGSVSSHEDSVREIPEPTVSHSYASETLTLDGASLLTVPAGFRAPVLWLLGAGTYLLGAPIVHLGHDRPLKALASLGLRLGAPIVGGLAVAGVVEEKECVDEIVCPDLGRSTAIFRGIAVGMGVAIAVDAIFIANEDVPVTPGFSLVHGGATGNVAGAF